MHEVAIAQAIVSLAERNADGRRVVAVEVAIGELRQVSPDALRFSFGLCAQGTAVEGAELRIERVAVGVACRRCAGEGGADSFPFRCPSCGSVDIDVVAGEELHVEALVLEDLEAEPAMM